MSTISQGAVRRRAQGYQSPHQERWLARKMASHGSTWATLTELLPLQHVRAVDPSVAADAIRDVSSVASATRKLVVSGAKPGSRAGFATSLAPIGPGSNFTGTHAQRDRAIRKHLADQTRASNRPGWCCRKPTRRRVVASSFVSLRHGLSELGKEPGPTCGMF